MHSTPARFNADGRRLHGASGCAGKIAVFAVRLDTYPIPKRHQVFYVGTNSPNVLVKFVEIFYLSFIIFRLQENIYIETVMMLLKNIVKTPL